MTAHEGHRCCTGRHTWLAREDAAKCCNPKYRRCVQVGTVNGQAYYSHCWERVDVAEREEAEIRIVPEASRN